LAMWHQPCLHKISVNKRLLI